MTGTGQYRGPAGLLDAIGYALGVLAAIILIPGIGRTPLGDLDTLYVLPVAVVGLSVFRLCHGVKGDQPSVMKIFRLRCSALCMVGLSPFLSWWFRFSGNLYLAVMALGGIVAFFWCLIETTSILDHAARCLGKWELARWARTVRHGLIFLSLAPILSYYAASLVLLGIDGSMTAADIGTWWVLTIPFPVRFCTMLPLLAGIGLFLTAAKHFGPEFLDTCASSGPGTPGNRSPNAPVPLVS